jgi:TolA-binding protein
MSEVGMDTAEDDYADPQVKALQQQVAQLQGFLQNQQQTQMQSVQQNTQSMIDQFAGEKDAEGNLKHPHFSEVRDRMGVLIQGNQAPDLPTAYEMAVYADPKLRQGLMDNYAASKTQKEVKTEAVKKAKKAQRSTVRGNATPAEKALPTGLSVRDTIMKSIQQLENNERG